MSGDENTPSELSAVLNRRQKINDDLDDGKEVTHVQKGYKKAFNPYTEFPEFSRKDIKEYEKLFKKYNVSNTGFLDLMELKLMMEKLGAPQTHMGLKDMIKEVDEDSDNKISYREFLLIYHKAYCGELPESSGLNDLARLCNVDVDEVGVTGAASFFQAKIDEQSKTNKFEQEIKAEQEEKRKEEEEKKMRRQAFKEKANIFVS